MENNVNLEINDDFPIENNDKKNNIAEEYTPKLFSEEQSNEIDSNSDLQEPRDNSSEELLDQDINEDEDFEIPAFLRRQKF
jgi:hypothetical protein